MHTTSLLWIALAASGLTLIILEFCIARRDRQKSCFVSVLLRLSKWLLGFLLFWTALILGFYYGLTRGDSFSSCFSAACAVLLACAYFLTSDRLLHLYVKSHHPVEAISNNFRWYRMTLLIMIVLQAVLMIW